MWRPKRLHVGTGRGQLFCRPTLEDGRGGSGEIQGAIGGYDDQEVIAAEQQDVGREWRAWLIVCHCLADGGNFRLTDPVERYKAGLADAVVDDLAEGAIAVGAVELLHDPSHGIAVCVDQAHVAMFADAIQAVTAQGVSIIARRPGALPFKVLHPGFPEPVLLSKPSILSFVGAGF